MKPARLTRTQRQLDTRERLVVAARDCFIARGFADTSVEHIAERAGYTRGAFYANFRHKRELLIEILRHDRPRLLARMLGSAHAHWSSSIPDDAVDIAAEWDCFPLWVEVHLYALRDAALRQIVEQLHAEPVPQATASGAAEVPAIPERMPSSAEWAALLGVALLRDCAQQAPRDEPA